MDPLRVRDPVPADLLTGLVDVLRDVVPDGASVGFVGTSRAGGRGWRERSACAWTSPRTPRTVPT
ncbi:hypothetical protein [Kineococcus sp. R86509]|uniref:hypothetical protein n=1 Tax=Kineococcus sp. R86509 TaxID=3093851 RepID=UPI0036D27B06